MKNKEKRECHIFLLTDYEKEEQFLRERHNQGYRLTRVGMPFFYYFEECEPEDVVYRLDFNPQEASEKEGYLQLYADYGWEYLQELNGFSYFRKKAANAEESELEIFCDNESKLEMLKRIFMKRMLLLMAIFLCAGVAQIPSIINGVHDNAAGIMLIVLWTILVVVYGVTFVHCGIGFYRLKKKYSQGTDGNVEKLTGENNRLDNEDR
ncbi:DUF2812 domain-containing protein [Anaerovorax odorimutans]|uniref:DUF2812 domain-containing protein n=1 Tax=Anaerovorax odorimutans TaxID=109327 RepID=A0ABT1RTK3_9FIRM|nr:DUF2812 domain-containing protein [Anaerovorax odorimutans]MCQ4638534.1 DUF2812 domain-containing protein [Anaerovorax odorimutans]